MVDALEEVAADREADLRCPDRIAACVSYPRAITLDPHDVDERNWLANRLRGNRPEEAKVQLEAAVRILKDGRRISVPLEWYPRLARATEAQLTNWELCGAGYGIHWTRI